ncbi:putative spermidine/putrescine transport system substrate-binding protein [Rhodoligotrophos appendicifer]|uniref:ABC transporter substrate-binding protein n=1 Tax=Rhodoligotrophos appendicifer TaxID=987056 RepID=UPI00118553D8|nr:extracellular solute-binding protein [Rhodoligotrophos appendicifer]
MLKFTRREFTRLGLAAPLAAVASSLPLAQLLAQGLGSELRVATWGGSWRDSIDTNVCKGLKDQGLKIEYTLGNPEDNLAKLIAATRQGAIPFDVMEGFPYITGPMSEGGLINELDYDKMPNAKAAPDWVRGKYEVVSVVTQDGVVYNTEKFKEAGIAPPTTYKDLANPKLKGKVAFPDIGNAQHWNAIVGMAYESGGGESNLSGAVSMVNEISPAYFFSASTDLATRFGSGDIWAAAWHAGWAARLRRSNVPVSVGYTPFGEKRGALWPVPCYIVAKTTNLAGAEAFVNQLMSPEVQFTHGKATGSVPVDGKARTELAADPLSAELLMLSDRQMQNCYQIDWSKLDIKAWQSTWARDIKR